MLDMSRLKAPIEHGQVLVAPGPQACASALQSNTQSLRSARMRLLDATLATWRRRTRRELIGPDDAPVIVIGHQPSFIHPGVWAKHIVAVRLATALDGLAVNLVVDSDAVQNTLLEVPSIQGDRIVLEHIRWPQTLHNQAYEQIARQGPEQIIMVGKSLRRAMGDRYEDSQMPTFVAGLQRATQARDWVDQMLSARQTIETTLGVTIHDRRVSRIGFLPLLADILVNAGRFSSCYNAALNWYRREFRVRGPQRPIPDLHWDQKRCEVPFWAYRAHEPRRRLFVEKNGRSLRLWAEGEAVGQVPVRDLRVGGLEAAFGELGDWHIRPRALTLTLWARLLLADLFIHGIGGAKYDRITDKIIADYYGLEPPHIACVSATLRLDLPGRATADETVHALRHGIRDLQYNPQRNLELGPDLDYLVARRAKAIDWAVGLQATDPGNRAARRAAFEAIRSANQAIIAVRPGEAPQRRRRLENAIDDLQQYRIAHGREYFFGLYSRRSLQRLLDTLPDERDFRV